MSKAKTNAKRQQAMDEQKVRDTAAICGAATRKGKLCRRQAGYGTDHPGRGRCSLHSGATRSNKIAVAHGDLSMATPLRNISAAGAIQAALNLSAGQLAYATAKVAELEEEQLFQAYINWETGVPITLRNIWLDIQKEVLQDMARFAKLAHDAGIAERDMSNREQQTALVAQLLDKVLGELKLTQAQRKQVAPAIRKHLMSVPQPEGQAA